MDTRHRSDSMTALVAAFARAHHARHSASPVFDDSVARLLLADEEYASIFRSMADGISYFAPGFDGSAEDAVRLAVERQLAPPVLARSAFAERAADAAIAAGCRQILVFACGYDTFSLRTPDTRLAVFELDRPGIIADRRSRIERAGLKAACAVASVGCDLRESGWPQALAETGYDAESPAFASLLGLVYYLPRATFAALLASLASMCPPGSRLCFDYPVAEPGEESRRARELAAAAGEEMQARYAAAEIPALLAGAGFSVCEHLDAAEASRAFFAAHNRAEPGHPMAAPAGVAYCLAERA